MKTWLPAPRHQHPTTRVRASGGPPGCRGRWLVVGCLLAFVLMPTVATADWLVTRDGQSIETQGPWKTKGRMVVFTNTAGLLLSMRLDEVDLEASETLTRHREQQANAPAPAEEPAPEDNREPVLVLTNDSVGLGQDGAQGAEALVQRLRNAHRFGDVGLAMGLVNTQDSPDGVLNYMRQQFEWLMEQRIQDVQLVEVPSEENLEQIQDGESYEPNLQVTHRMTIDLVPDPDQDTSTLTLLVGLRLGSYYIAAARPSEVGQ